MVRDRKKKRCTVCKGSGEVRGTKLTDSQFWSIQPCKTCHGKGWTL